VRYRGTLLPLRGSGIVANKHLYSPVPEGWNRHWHNTPTSLNAVTGQHSLYGLTQRGVTMWEDGSCRNPPPPPALKSRRGGVKGEEKRFHLKEVELEGLG